MMRYLPLKIRRNGFTYTQVLRNGRSAIYEQRVSPEIAFYEVFLIKVKPEIELFGKIIPKREAYPSNEDFGNIAWACTDLEHAVNRLLSINNKSDQR